MRYNTAIELFFLVHKFTVMIPAGGPTGSAVVKKPGGLPVSLFMRENQYADQ
jgi:hypothetical protein